MVVALVLLVLGLVGAVQAFRLGLGGLSEPGPGFLPFCVAVGLAAVSTALCLRGEARPAPDKEAEPVSLLGGRTLAVLGGLIFYVVALEWLGFATTTLVFLAVMFAAIERFRWARALCASLAIAGGLHLLFNAVGVHVPIAFWSR